jgi:CHAD domain-containing protein/CYTH domain-containing protein
MTQTALPPLIQGGLFTPTALEAPVTHGVVALATERLDRLRAARDQLRLAEDDEALHDFRVALRRVRSLLRGYRNTTRITIPPRLPRGLRRLSRTTGVSRDLEVKLSWLTGIDDLRPRDRVGHRWLTKRLNAAKVRSDTRVAKYIEAMFFPLTTNLERRLEQLLLHEKGAARSLASETASNLRALLDIFASRLDVVDAIGKQEEAHLARIAGKKVRYLLEPFVRIIPAAREVVDRYKGVQEALGELRDAHVLGEAIAAALEDAALERGHRVAERIRDGDRLDRQTLRRERRRDPMPGLMALASLVHARREKAWREVNSEWLAHRGALLIEPVLAIADDLASRGSPGIEIERKFLLSRLPEAAEGAERVDIDQGYLPGERIRERIRRTRNGQDTRWFRTLKLGTGLVRQETEEETTEAVFEAMWPLTEGRRVQKRRYHIPDGELVWEVDQFDDRNLVLAEVELPSEDHVATPPEWLAPCIVREVTDDPDYQNVNLAW